VTDQMILHLSWTIIFGFICLFALVRGGQPERITVCVLIGADLISSLVLRAHHWKAVEPSLVVIDFCVAIFFVGLALKSSRWWPLWAAAFHLLAVIMIVASTVGAPVRPYAYFVGELIWDYLGLAALLLGTLLEARRDVGNPGGRQIY